jgi:hypothetical protein
MFTLIGDRFHKIFLFEFVILVDEIVKGKGDDQRHYLEVLGCPFDIFEHFLEKWSFLFDELNLLLDDLLGLLKRNNICWSH